MAFFQQSKGVKPVTIYFTVPGPPVGKARPKVVRAKNGMSMTYTPDKTVAYEELVRLRFNESLQGHPFEPLQGALRIKIFAGYPIPKSTSKKRRAAMLAGTELPTKKPDWDSIGKIICDALNGVAYEDDKQVTESQMRKRYIDGPGQVEVWISNL
jgi:Holliday junction resolvase RusA-like endonuclease